MNDVLIANDRWAQIVIDFPVSIQIHRNDRKVELKRHLEFPAHVSV